MQDKRTRSLISWWTQLNLYSVSWALFYRRLITAKVSMLFSCVCKLYWHISLDMITLCSAFLDNKLGILVRPRGQLQRFPSSQLDRKKIHCIWVVHHAPLTNGHAMITDLPLFFCKIDVYNYFTGIFYNNNFWQKSETKFTAAYIFM